MVVPHWLERLVAPDQGLPHICDTLLPQTLDPYHANLHDDSVGKEWLYGIHNLNLVVAPQG